MLDMDQTLVESVFPNDKRYKKCDGKILFYDEKGNRNTFKVNVRPYALHLIKTIKQHNHQYVVWSAGKFHYVHAVMDYLNQLCQIKPDLIYTRKDMVNINGHILKSLSSKNFDSNYVIIIEDHPDFVDPAERKNVISVKSWLFDDKDDVELQWICQILATYGVITSLYNTGTSDFLHYSNTCEINTDLL